jgi:hypothetical protein
MDTNPLKTPRTTLKRVPDRGSHEWDEIASILDEALICHIGFEVGGQPYVIPTSYGRDDRTLYIHGSAASRMLRHVSGGVPVCFTVTLVDGLILARSVFHNSMNYRSVVVLGAAELLTDDADKLHGLEIVTEHVIRGRWQDSRPPTAQELKATSVLRLPIEEASAKLRTHGVKDEPEDIALPHWAGFLPLTTTIGPPETDPDVRDGTEVPDYVRDYRRPQR